MAEPRTSNPVTEHKGIKVGDIVIPSEFKSYKYDVQYREETMSKYNGTHQKVVYLTDMYCKLKCGYCWPHHAVTKVEE